MSDYGYDTYTTWDTSYDTSYSTWDTDTTQAWHNEYSAWNDHSWNLYNASTDAWLHGDTELAYNLNVASVEAGGHADDAWGMYLHGGSSWDTGYDTSYSTWDSGYDTSYSTWDTGYDTSYSTWDSGYDLSY